jgi:hypothetical protein
MVYEDLEFDYKNNEHNSIIINFNRNLLDNI